MISEGLYICIISIGSGGLGAALALGHKNSIDIAALKAWKHEHENTHQLIGVKKHDTI